MACPKQRHVWLWSTSYFWLIGRSHCPTAQANETFTSQVFAQVYQRLLQGCCTSTVTKVTADDGAPVASTSLRVRSNPVHFNSEVLCCLVSVHQEFPKSRLFNPAGLSRGHAASTAGEGSGSRQPQSPATELTEFRGGRGQEEDKAWTQSPATELTEFRRTRPGHRAQPQS